MGDATVSTLLGTETPCNPVGALLELFDEPAWTLDAAGQLLSWNRSGLGFLSSGRLLRLQQGQVVCEHARHQADFADACRLVADDSDARRQVGLTGYGRTLPLVLELARFPTSGLLASESPNSLLVVVHDLASRRVAPSEVVAEVLSLTMAEARVAAQLAQDWSSTEIAEETGISLHTIRTQLRSIFGKVGVDRQSALVRVVVGIPARWERGPEAESR